MPKLIKPAQNFNQQIREFRKEFLESGDSMDGSGGLRHYEDPADWIANLKDIEYLYVREEDEKIIGLIQISPVLNAYLEKFGGHIGYCVAPSERRKGYATQMLHDILPLCKEMGIGKLLVTCIKGNEGSRQTILKNGGVYESTVYEPDDGLEIERYWIELFDGSDME